MAERTNLELDLAERRALVLGADCAATERVRLALGTLDLARAALDLNAQACRALSGEELCQGRTPIEAAHESLLAGFQAAVRWAAHELGALGYHGPRAAELLGPLDVPGDEEEG